MKAIDFSSFDTKNVTDMNCMFGNCRSLTTLNLSNFDTGNVAIMMDMFQGCSGLASLDISSFDTSNMKRMDLMFQNRKNLKKLVFGNFKINESTSIERMFMGINPNVEVYLSVDSPSVEIIQDQLINGGVYGTKVHVGDKAYSYDASSKKWNAC